MKTTAQYLEDIAVSVLGPLGKLYIVRGMDTGMLGYSGIHPINAHDKLWDQWICVCILDLSEIRPVVYKDACTLYRLYWTADSDRQSSWWVKDIQL